ncbi:imm11 family protein [Sessilibacter sp. MAH3]
MPYWLFHVNLKTDLSYVDNSQSQRNIDETGFIEVNKLSFLKNKVESLLIFKSQFNNYESIYCNQAFKDLIENNQLKGLNFSNNLASEII